MTKTKRMTMTALKKLIKVGTRILVVSHWRDVVRRDLPPQAGKCREVVKVQGNGYWYRCAEVEKRCWAEWVPAKDVTFHDDGSWTMNFGKGTGTFKIDPSGECQ